MAVTMSLRMSDELVEKLDRQVTKRGFGISRSGCITTLLEEHLREMEFPLIEFRDTMTGRQVYMKGTRLTVWWVIHVAQTGNMSEEQLSAHFTKPEEWVRAALAYYACYTKEIDAAIKDHRAADYEALKRDLPGLELAAVSFDDES